MRLASIMLAALAATGCTTEGGRPLVVLENLQPAEGCTFSTSGDTFITIGRIDTQATSGYQFTPLVRNTAVSVADDPGARLALVQGADVELSVPQDFFGDAGPPDGFADDASFTKLFSGAIEPDGGETYFSFIVMDKQFMDDYLAPGLSAGQMVEVTARVTIFGQMGGGDTSSVPFNYPIEVCNGCMTQDLGACVDLDPGFVGSAGGECNTLQDVVLECCDDGAVCPATPPA
jgi:hypothetical protein